MTDSTADQLKRIGDANEPRMQSRRGDGTPNSPRTVWVDAAYQAEYSYSPPAVARITSPAARSATLKFTPA